MREIWTLTWKLLLIAAVAGLALGLTNGLTQEPIAQQIVSAANQARMTVLPSASDFELVSEGENGCDNIYIGKSDGETVGYTAQITTRGYGGEIEITIGVDMSGTVNGVNIGGANFAETAGLGAKVKDPAFRDQFAGQKGPYELGKSIDAVTAATISSKAVVNAVNQAYDALISVIG